jgi:hypothetical protein
VMLRQISDMPLGTVGFEGIGKVEDDDFEHTVEPVLRGEIAAGRTIGLLHLLGPELREYEGDTLGEEMTFAARHPTAYERVTVVSDEDWIRPALCVLSVLVPGQLRAFPAAQLAAAREWLATAGDRGADDKA